LTAIPPEEEAKKIKEVVLNFLCAVHGVILTTSILTRWKKRKTR